MILVMSDPCKGSKQNFRLMNGIVDGRKNVLINELIDRRANGRISDVNNVPC